MTLIFFRDIRFINNSLLIIIKRFVSDHKRPYSSRRLMKRGCVRALMQAYKLYDYKKNQKHMHISQVLKRQVMKVSSVLRISRTFEGFVLVCWTLTLCTLCTLVEWIYFLDNSTWNLTWNSTSNFYWFQINSNEIKQRKLQKKLYFPFD